MWVFLAMASIEVMFGGRSLVVGGSTVGLSGLGSRASSLVTTRGVVAAKECSKGGTSLRWLG